jgi:uncharacterized protein (DUF1501 family)
MPADPSRRHFLQVGYSGFLGLSLPALLTGRAHAARNGRASTAAAPRKAKSVLLVFLTGAPSHIDTLDPKPDAPSEIRGEFKPIATKVAGIHFGEHLPNLAARADRLAVVRSLSHRENNHLLATHHMLTGAIMAGGKPDQIASRNDWPNYASGLDYVRPRHDGVPSGVILPTFLMEGPLVWPGQHAGLLGARHDPWHVKQDPNKPNFRVEGLRLPTDAGPDRLAQRRSLLEQVSHGGGPMAEQQELAFSILASGQVTQAFDIDREPERVRERYGRHAFGQSLLMARRLLQAGVPLVQANMGHVQTWDAHGDIFPRLKDQLLPPLDRGVSALLDDLEAHGLLDETLVVLLGEFGRSPKVTPFKGAKLPGRDHWAPCFSALFAGAGVRGGQVIGRSDKIGAYPATPPFSPTDVGATVYQALGVDTEAEILDPLGRPMRLNRGTRMDALFTG